MDRVVEIRNDCVHKVGKFALSQSEFDEFKITHATLKQELEKAIARGVKSDDEIRRMTLIKGKLNKNAKYPKKEREIRAYDRYPKRQSRHRESYNSDKKEPLNYIIAVVLIIIFVVIAINKM